MRAAPAASISELEAELASERERRRALEAQLRNLADHDPVTDLLNRCSIEQELVTHLARCERYGPEGALLLVALDGLDRVAVRVGQRDADEALVALAERLADRVRATDLVGRWSAEELAILLPRAGVAEVVVLADALVRIVAETGTDRVPPGSMVASVGVALVAASPVGADQPERTIEQAHGALAAARRRGGGWAAADG